jgi:ribosomal protein S8
MEVKISSKMKEEILDFLKDFGYKSEKEFIEDAILHRILELKKIDFLMKSEKIKTAMRKKGITEKEILRDFERFRHSIK